MYVMFPFHLSFFEDRELKSFLVSKECKDEDTLIPVIKYSRREKTIGCRWNYSI